MPNRQKQQEMLEGQMAASEDMMSEIDAINKQTAILEQEKDNKTHDTEFSQYSQGISTLPVLEIVSKEEVEEAMKILLEYKESKQKFERKIAENEMFWNLDHWQTVQSDDVERIKPISAYLVNTILNKHADCMDNYPEPNILPRTRDDEETAKILSKVVPVILEQNGYYKTYSTDKWEKLKNGTGMQGIFWNNDKNNGLGDIDVKVIDPYDLFWDMTARDIQDSANVFLVDMIDRKEIQAMYPELKVGSNILPLVPETQGSYANSKEYADKTAVVDWYYKRRIRGEDEDGIPHMKTILHYCKFCEGQVIYASENDPNYKDRGWYDHGLYPFVLDPLYPIKRTAVGMGYIDLIKDNQLYTDKLRQAILESAVSNARPRWAVNNQGGLNEKEFSDMNNPIVHFNGTLGENDFRQINGIPLSPVYQTVYLQQVQDMKDTSGNTAASQGQVSSVTAASGIASLQEAAGKLSRDSNASSYDAYKQVVYMIIELIRQFYDEPRCFRIAGETGEPEYVDFDNSGLVPQPQESAFGIDLGNRLPIMDIDVKPQKRSAYSKETQNQTALNLYSAGFFAPQNTDAALACLNMMDFDGIEKVKDKIQENGTLYEQLMMMQQQLMQMAAVVDAQNGTNMVAQMNGEQPQQQQSNAPQQSKGSLSSQAASATRESTSPR